MKRTLFVLFTTLILSSAAFAERHWNDRIFEINVDAPVNISNNMFTIDELFQETVVIDFTKIADELPSSGFNAILSAKPSVGFKLDIPSGLVFGLKTGVDAYSTFSIGKSLFDFLGYGNQLNENISVDFGGYGDIFVYLQADLGWDYDKFKIVFSPSLYAALFHVTTEGSNITISNSSEGEFGYNLRGNLNIYSLIGFDDSLQESLKEGNFGAVPETFFAKINDIWSGAGFDIQATLDYELTKYLTLSGTLKTPVVPARLTYRIPMTIESSYETSIMSLTQGSTEAPEVSTNFGDMDRVMYKINRPLKLNVNANFHPWNGIMEYYAGLGIGFDHPFASNPFDRGYYFDYILGTRFGLFNLLNVYLSTERTDRLFINKAMLSLNIRLVEIDVGVASESTSFIKSFQAGGLGGFANVKVGL